MRDLWDIQIQLGGLPSYIFLGLFSNWFPATPRVSAVLSAEYLLKGVNWSIQKPYQI